MSHWKDDDGSLVSEHGDVMTKEQAQEAIRRTIELTGKFILAAN
jgi:hypothetical protein